VARKKRDTFPTPSIIGDVLKNSKKNSLFTKNSSLSVLWFSFPNARSEDAKIVYLSA
jgi:hypothetical protein